MHDKSLTRKMAIYNHPYAHTQKGHPSLVELELTSACNAKCIFCPRHLFTHPKMMTRETFSQVLFRLVEGEMKYVKLVGIGEPTLHHDLLWIMRKINEEGLRVLLNTNGSRLHRLDIDEILSLCTEIIVSFHSLTPDIHKKIFGVDYYAQALSNIEKLLKVNERYNRTITLYVVLTTFNRDALSEIKNFFGSQVQIRASGCTNRTLEGFTENISDKGINCQYNHYPMISSVNSVCGYAEAAIVIDSEGHYLLCTNDIKRNTGLQTVWDKTISEVSAEIWQGSRSGRFLEVCRNCDNFEEVGSPYNTSVL